MTPYHSTKREDRTWHDEDKQDQVQETRMFAHWS